MACDRREAGVETAARYVSYSCPNRNSNRFTSNDLKQGWEIPILKTRLFADDNAALS